jgi:hypothetical protein
MLPLFIEKHSVRVPPVLAVLQNGRTVSFGLETIETIINEIPGILRTLKVKKSMC